MHVKRRRHLDLKQGQTKGETGGDAKMFRSFVRSREKVNAIKTRTRAETITERIEWLVGIQRSWRGKDATNRSFGETWRNEQKLVGFAFVPKNRSRAVLVRGFTLKRISSSTSFLFLLLN